MKKDRTDRDGTMMHWELQEDGIFVQVGEDGGRLLPGEIGYVEPPQMQSAATEGAPVDLDAFRDFPPGLSRLFPFRLRALVVRVIDGDTVRVLLDQAVGSRMDISVRFSNISAPESYHPKSEEERRRGLEAKAELEAVLPPGTPVGVESRKLERDFEHSYLRIVGEIKREVAPGAVVDVGDEMAEKRPDLFEEVVWNEGEA